MKICEWPYDKKPCTKVATFGTTNKHVPFACNEHATYTDAWADPDGVWRLPLDPQTLAKLLDEEFTRGGDRPDVGLAMVAGTERVLDARDAELESRTHAILKRVCERWTEGDL